MMAAMSTRIIAKAIYFFIERFAQPKSVATLECKV
jgi:hypothetical protein